MFTESIQTQFISLLSLPTYSLTIYPSRAAIVRDIANIKILPGRNEITLGNFPLNVEERSFRVEARDTVGLITDVKVEPVPNTMPEAKNVFSGDDEDSSSDGEGGRDDLLLNARNGGGKATARKPERESARLEQQRMKPKDVYVVRVTIEYEPPPKGATPAAEPARRERAKPRGENSGWASLRVSYVTCGASWTPRYDVQLDTLTNMGELTYSARFSNRTGETWRNAQITLSAGQATFGGLEDTAPLLDSWNISLVPDGIGNCRDGGHFSEKEKNIQDEGRKRHFGRHCRKPDDQEHDDPSRYDDDYEGFATTTLTAPPGPLGSVTPTAEFYGLTANYCLPGIHTVISSALVSQCTIVKHKLTEITFSHLSVPKLRPSVFLKARICNRSPIVLLRGPVGLSLDGTFLGTAAIPFCEPEEHFEFALGVDESVLLEYRKSTCAVPSQCKSVGWKSLTYQRCISICNKRESYISLVVIDQVPVSGCSGLKVHVRKPLALVGGSAKGTAAAGIVVVGPDKESLGFLANATVEMRKGGKVRWEAKVRGGARVRIGLEYEVEFPTGYRICEI